MADLTEMLKALADDSRLKMVVLLLKWDYCVGALARKLDLTESAVSQHLKVLRMAGLVTGEKRGYYTHYQVDRNLLMALAEQLKTLASSRSEISHCQKSSFSNQNCCKKERKKNE